MYSKYHAISIMNNKVEIFELALKAGCVELTEEQSKFAIECFIKAEKLSGGQFSHQRTADSNPNGLKKKVDSLT